MKILKKIFANKEAVTRMKAIEYYQQGHSQREVAEKFKIHQTTVGEWVRLYEQGGAEALKAPLKPRKEYNLDEAALLPYLSYPLHAHKAAALIDLAKGKGLNETAAEHNVTPQGLAKWRREYTEGKWDANL